MSKLNPYVAVTLIFGLNFLAVFGASLLASNLDDTSVAYLVRVFGVTWVGAFAIASLYFLQAGSKQDAVDIAAITLPYALIAAVLLAVGDLLLWSARQGINAAGRFRLM